ncbi:hypothetical protein DEU56DRAFT_905646 [Suillus clintonianus]|uniref:uncharacterized protein n=1 Tax=Suillus clintonianus TaxID=1904413 RepID=UPI001B85C6B7|nr:uncharacterized protein DEU56DRAFT_905646 [Suillus clintonianus]KAG2107815.1 hypothetical protein DEU56DRAFT_905646 [Suillus clintonianus]
MTSRQLDIFWTYRDAYNDDPAEKSSCPRLSFSRYAQIFLLGALKGGGGKEGGGGKDSYPLPAPFRSVPAPLSPKLCRNLPPRTLYREEGGQGYIPTPRTTQFATRSSLSKDMFEIPPWALYREEGGQGSIPTPRTS